MSWDVKFFQTARGDYPVKEFIDDLDKPIRAKVANLVCLLTDYGPRLSPPYAKKIQDKLYELRVSGKIAVRIFYTTVNGKYYLLHGFKKKTEKTPLKDIKTALDRTESII